MKKTYIKPATHCVQVMPQTMIAESLNMYDSGGGTVLVKENDFDFDMPDNGGGGSIWDDDDWDE